PNWQRQRIQNPSSVSSSLTRGTIIKPSQESFSARVLSCLGRDVGTDCSHGSANTGGQGGLFYRQEAWRVVFRRVVIIGRGPAEEPEHAGHINGVSQVAKIFRAHQRWGFNDFVLAELRAQGF